MQPGPHGAWRNAKRVCDLGAGKPDVVVHDEDSALLGGQPPEGSFELVAQFDGLMRVISRWTDIGVGDQPKPWLPTPRVPRFGITGVDEQAVKPRLEPIVIAQAAKFPPRRQECLLDRVLCSTRVAKDPICDEVQAVTELKHERREGIPISPLRSVDDVPVHGDSCDVYRV